jgi:hypothetical protein
MRFLLRVFDPDDDMFLGCAALAKADSLVAGDKDLLTLGEYKGTRIVTPSEYLRARQALRCLARFRAGVGPVPAPEPCQDGSILAHWIAVLTVIRKQAGLVYASSAKRTASTRPGPFLGTVFFLDRGLMMLIAEASSCVFKCAA